MGRVLGPAKILPRYQICGVPAHPAPGWSTVLGSSQGKLVLLEERLPSQRGDLSFRLLVVVLSQQRPLPAIGRWFKDHYDL